MQAKNPRERVLINNKMETPQVYVEEHYKDLKLFKKRFCYEGEKPQAISLIEYNIELASGESIPNLVKDLVEKKVLTKPIIENKNISHINISKFKKDRVVILKRGFNVSELEELAKEMAVPKED